MVVVALTNLPENVMFINFVGLRFEFMLNYIGKRFNSAVDKHTFMNITFFGRFVTTTTIFPALVFTISISWIRIFAAQLIFYYYTYNIFFIHKIHVLSY